MQVKKSRITTALVARGSSARAGPVIQAKNMRKLRGAGKKPVASSIALAEESSGGGVRSRGRSLELKGNSLRASPRVRGPFRVGPDIDYGDTSASAEDEKDLHDAPASHGSSKTLRLVKFSQKKPGRVASRSANRDAGETKARAQDKVHHLRLPGQ